MINPNACIKLFSKMLQIEEKIIDLDREEGLSFTAFLNKILSPRKASIVDSHFGLTDKKLSLREIGKILGISHEWVRQLESEALDHLRMWFAGKLDVQAYLYEEIILQDKALKRKMAKNHFLKIRNVISKKILATPIENLALSKKVCAYLQHIGIKTLDNLITKAATDQSWIGNMDVESFRKVENLLAKYGLNLLSLL